MPREIPKAYEPHAYEDAIYAAWEQSGMFAPAKEGNGAFSMVLPPPNVTGTLHLGHAAMLAIEDAMVRFARLSGKKTLWVPGTDHAAIATQSKVEKLLTDKYKDPRKELGREAFLSKVNEFALASHDTIVGQVRKMGASIDWSREAYTLDETRNRAVNLVFKQMYQDGLIYRGFRVVNWDPLGRTVISDDEVLHKETMAKLVTFTYGKEFPIAISTTRPETKVGDTAVAVHPEDTRYTAFVGKTFAADFCGVKLEIKVVADASVDMAFGTGALGVTPAHSSVDAEIAERHGLPMKQVIGEDGRMTAEAGILAGMTTAEARAAAIEWIRAQGLLQKEEDVAQSLSVAERSGGPIEPLPKMQWFIGVNRPFTFKQSTHAPIKGLKDGQQITLKELMQHVVRDGEIEIIPEHFNKTYFRWIDNLRDWNISRQIWFGHRVPVWYHDTCQVLGPKGESTYQVPAIVGKFEPDAKGLYWCSKCKNGYDSKDHFTQDSDTLDTWFSSGLWTFSTLLDPSKAGDDLRAWANASADFKTFHPTSVLETGYDIIFFWVARMILMTTYAIGEVPFKTVYLHGLVRDEQGRKMSKSLGNIIDPVDMIQKYGADATRLALVLGSTPGNDVKLSEEKIAGFRNFTNKLWNISRFVLTSVSLVPSPQSLTPDPQTLADKWILSRFARVQEQVTKNLEAHAFSAAGELLRDFTWGDFADWYLEIAKIQRAEHGPSTDKNLLYILSRLFAMWHPFMPFVTEELWKQFGTGSFLMTAAWPTEAGKVDEAAEKDFEHVMDSIRSIRVVRAEHKVEPNVKVDVVIASLDKEVQGILEESQKFITYFGRVENLKIGTGVEVPENAIPVSFGKFVVHVILAKVDPLKERARLTEEIANLEGYVSSTDAKLANAEFTAKAPAKVVDTMRAKKQEAETKLTELKKQLSALA